MGPVFEVVAEVKCYTVNVCSERVRAGDDIMLQGLRRHTISTQADQSKVNGGTHNGIRDSIE